MLAPAVFAVVATWFETAPVGRPHPSINRRPIKREPNLPDIIVLGRKLSVNERLFTDVEPVQHGLNLTGTKAMDQRKFDYLSWRSRLLWLQGSSDVPLKLGPAAYYRQRAFSYNHVL